MQYTSHFVAGLPQLDIHTLSEDWALAAALENHWIVLARSLGLKPSDWRDAQGDRMYAAVIHLSTAFDLEDPLREDDAVVAETRVVAVRKPHALSRTCFAVEGRTKAEVRILTSFIKRKVRGSNKKFAKVRDIWAAPDFDGAVIDAELDRHHAMKSQEMPGERVMDYEVNRIQDFNTADFLYFKNFVRIAKAAEWKQNRGHPTRLNSQRSVWYFGNVEDGDIVGVDVGRPEADTCTTVLTDAEGRRLCLSVATTPLVSITPR
jgi:probable biosynthetic protein (TIGR04098 family)